MECGCATRGLVQAQDKDAARTAGNRHGEPNRMDLDGIAPFSAGLATCWTLI
jgi:hypothetical protein